MKRKLFFVFLLSCLALFDSRPGLADSANPIPTDLLVRLEKEGWKTAAPGVMQHTVGSTVETLGFGDDGLRFKIQDLKAHLAFLRKEFAHHPSPELRQAIRAHRAELLRAQAALKEAGELASSYDALVATGANCSANYDPRTGPSPSRARGLGPRRTPISTTLVATPARCTLTPTQKPAARATWSRSRYRAVRLPTRPGPAPT